MKEKNIVLSEKGMYRLFTKSNCNLFLGVLCGNIGMYEVVIKLNHDEKISYQQIGKDYLDDLAERIRESPESYKDRWVT